MYPYQPAGWQGLILASCTRSSTRFNLCGPSWYCTQLGPSLSVSQRTVLGVFFVFRCSVPAAIVRGPRLLDHHHPPPLPLPGLEVGRSSADSSSGSMYRYWLFDHNNVNPIVTSILLHWYAPYIVIIAFLKHSPHFIQLVPIGVCCCGFLVLFILSTSLPFPHPGLLRNREAGHGGAIPNREREQEVSHSGKWVGNRTRRRRIRGKREGHVLFCRNFEMLHSNEPMRTIQQKKIFKTPLLST